MSLTSSENEKPQSLTKVRVLITGATGMVGSLVLRRCLESQEVGSVMSLLRRPSGLEHTKLTEVVLENFIDLDESADYFEGIDVVYYCLGVYTGAVDRETFRLITVGYPAALANVLVKKGHDTRFCLLSGAGADRNEQSRMSFAKDKGTIENILSEMGFKAFHSFRPGYIYPVTPRVEPNMSYRISRWLYPVMKLMGNNVTIRSTELALSMFLTGLKGCPQEILENEDILKRLL